MYQPFYLLSDRKTRNETITVFQIININNTVNDFIDVLSA